MSLRKIFGANRWTYNKIVETLGKDIYTKKALGRKKEVRKFAIKGEIAKLDDPIDFSTIPEEALDSAFRDVYKARESSLALAESKKIKLKTFRFRSAKAPSQSIEIRARAIKQKQRYIRFWSKSFGLKKNEGILIKENLPELNYSCRLQKTRTGKYYLCIPTHKEYQKNNTGKICALDPGVRCFQTIYDPEGDIVKFGQNFDKIKAKLYITDRLKSRLKKGYYKKNKRWHMKRLFLNTLEKVRNMIKNCHHEISKWLAMNYDYVILPTFPTSKMVRKKRLSSKACRSMMTWSHYKFRQLLKFKINNYGSYLPDNITEEYTTKTCTRCGRINYNIVKQKVFFCNDCNLVMDRDVNGARNILLKHLSVFR